MIKRSNQRGKKVVRECKYCSCKFEALLIKIKQGKEIFCSKECYFSYRSYIKENTEIPKEKKCPKCNITKESSLFSKCKGRADGLNPYCKECHSVYRKDYYENNKERRLKLNAIRVKGYKDWYKNYKKDLKCERCGFNKHPAALDFHHKNNNKEYNVSQMVVQGYSPKSILKEIKKCEVLCRNCHAIEHLDKYY